MVDRGTPQGKPFSTSEARVNRWYFRGLLDVTVDPAFPAGLSSTSSTRHGGRDGTQRQPQSFASAASASAATKVSWRASRYFSSRWRTRVSDVRSNARLHPRRRRRCRCRHRVCTGRQPVRRYGGRWWNWRRRQTAAHRSDPDSLGERSFASIGTALGSEETRTGTEMPRRTDPRYGRWDSETRSGSCWCSVLVWH